MSYLCDRSQAVSVNEERSGFLPLARGVPQGSVLGPVAYSIVCCEINANCDSIDNNRLNKL